MVKNKELINICNDENSFNFKCIVKLEFLKKLSFGIIL